MNHPATPVYDTPVYTSALEAYVASAAIPLVIYGYPLTESIRTCRLQTSVAEVTGYGRAPINALSASQRQWTHEDRDIVTPANDLLYFCGWINLADGPVTLAIPARPDPDRYFVVELLDAFTDNFINLGIRNVPATGGTYRLLGPEYSTGSDDANDVRCPTTLVWLLGRVLVNGQHDLDAARSFQSGFAITDHPGSRRPACVDQWVGGDDAAIDFFQNLFAALKEFPPAPHELGLPALLRRVGIRIEEGVDVAGLKPVVVQGLINAYRQGMKLVEANTRSQFKKSWGYSLKLGKWGDDYLLRATTAMKGLGALSADEAVYALGDYDGDGKLLDGAHRYELRFAPGMLPPAEAFWSVSLYGKDFYFIANPIGRYAIGNRTPGLRLENDGGLVITISHEAPADTANWLPAPSGPFYLILRLYHPSAGFIAGQYVIPAVSRID
ncbi:DUF1254 domain-containing protein [Noviherbaspirillum saxi]|uniref:DUF1254 domain-containing protein n=1 Tax=Noviherbaspirillum saxi TaxID=2320863 RepID=A0A3A3FJR3_9BURK|nr:DUF1254 domain-containing protein [Noviherbaspirillum saxi]RJF95537.1 DUF1254 domain-containing protein [Noviherbaspirillum saxi]